MLFIYFMKDIMMKKTKKKIKVIDLFCGIWWLTHWLINEWLPVVAGFDIDWSCKFWYEYNNHAKFYEQDIKSLKAEQLNEIYWDADIRILVWCAPCQPYSLMNVKKWNYTWEEIKERSPLDKFANLIDKIKPEIVSMENVPGLASDKKWKFFEYFLNILDKNWYTYEYKVVNCTDYWIPQTRKRLVLLASRIGEIHLLSPKWVKKKTVKDAIWNLPHLNNGESCPTDRYHVCQMLTQKNIKRLELMPKDWWDLLDIDQIYRPECYKKKSWKWYLNNVYWRMSWNKPAPTMTTFCTWIWNWRFWHPEQNRAISVREAARIQTFPDDYEFFPEWEPCNIQKASKFIWNAVPVELWEVIWKSIKKVL